MARRLLDLLRVMAREIIDKGYEAEETLQVINSMDIDFVSIKEELHAMEVSRHIDDAELDTIKALLAYLLMRDSELEIDDVYAFVFGRGRQITWN